MRKIITLAAILLTTLAGCATDATIHSTTSELSGTYYSGDGLGRNVTIILSPDGTYSSDWQGCLGVYGESNGTWLVQAERIVFTPFNEKDELAGYLTRATTIQHAGRLGFARDQDLKHDRVNEQLIFLREPPQL
jgi:hypothetical protein